MVSNRFYSLPTCVNIVEPCQYRRCLICWTLASEWELSDGSTFVVDYYCQNIQYTVRSDRYYTRHISLLHVLAIIINNECTTVGLASSLYTIDIVLLNDNFQILYYIKFLVFCSWWNISEVIYNKRLCNIIL
jgi:hypothetical protein